MKRFLLSSTKKIAAFAALGCLFTTQPFSSIALANDSEAFVGYWEIDPVDCKAPQDDKQGAFMVISNRPDDLQLADGASALMVAGDYRDPNGRIGGTCKLNSPSRSGDRVTYDALCQLDDEEFEPTQFEMSIVYDNKHLAFRDKRGGPVSFYSLCSRDPDTWFNEQLDQSASVEEEQEQVSGLKEFAWLPKAWCSRVYSRQSDYVTSGECAESVAQCMGGDGQEEDCPAFARCEYWTKGRLKSSGTCGFAIRADHNSADFYWIWRNGNIVSVHQDARNGQFRWANREVETSQSDNKSCFELPSTGEKFCTFPYQRAGF